MVRKQNKLTLPKHIGIIMDGNGRWAKLRGLPRRAGHKIGAQTFRRVVRYCNHLGIAYLTVYAFSTENWKRPQEEVKAIIELLREYLLDASEHTHENIQVQFIGDTSQFDENINNLIKECEDESRAFSGLHLNIAINYGGRMELVNAFKNMTLDLQSGTLTQQSINEKTIGKYLYTAGQPDVDLIIRPSGEYRLSNFMVWQAAYAEYIFMENILWPDFKEEHIDKALKEFDRRNRRFGGID